jgi:hypothetical protein
MCGSSLSPSNRPQPPVRIVFVLVVSSLPSPS